MLKDLFTVFSILSSVPRTFALIFQTACACFANASRQLEVLDYLCSSVQGLCHAETVSVSSVLAEIEPCALLVQREFFPTRLRACFFFRSGLFWRRDP